MDPSLVVVEQMINEQNVINFMNSKLYWAAMEGRIHPFNSYTEPLTHLLTPTKNTILHVHVSCQTERANVSTHFMKQILAKCPSLLLQTNNRGETLLHLAARLGHATTVQCLIDLSNANHQDIETGAGAASMMLRMENIDKETALHEAARHNNPAVVEILTKEDPEFTYSANRLGETPLYLAVERGYSKIVFQILDTCSSPSFDGPNGRTALHEAVIRNSSEMTEKIVEAEKELVKEVDKHGWAPLHHASFFGYLSIVNLLLECDKSVAYVADNDGLIPLHLAASCGDSHEEVVFSILEHCPDCHELVDRKGRNVLHFVVQSRSNLLLRHMLRRSHKNEYYFPFMTNLVNQKDVDGNTPLHLLATYCFYNTTLIGHPLVDKMAVNNNSSTPLDIVSESADDHFDGLRGFTLKIMKRVGGYKHSRRNFAVLQDPSPRVTNPESIERTKTSHIIVAALLVTVTFTAGFTMPGGYDNDKGTAMLSKNIAFVVFVITDALAFLLSTCALFFYYCTDLELTKRRKSRLVVLAARLILLSVFLMLIAFEAAVFSVLQDSMYLKVIVGVITILSIFIFYSPAKRVLPRRWPNSLARHKYIKISSTSSNNFVEC